MQGRSSPNDFQHSWCFNQALTEKKFSCNFLRWFPLSWVQLCGVYAAGSRQCVRIQVSIAGCEYSDNAGVRCPSLALLCSSGCDISPMEANRLLSCAPSKRKQTSKWRQFSCWNQSVFSLFRKSIFCTWTTFTSKQNLNETCLKDVGATEVGL